MAASVCLWVRVAGKCDLYCTEACQDVSLGKPRMVIQGGTRERGAWVKRAPETPEAA